MWSSVWVGASVHSCILASVLYFWVCIQYISGLWSLYVSVLFFATGVSWAGGVYQVLAQSFICTKPRRVSSCTPATASGPWKLSHSQRVAHWVLLKSGSYPLITFSNALFFSKALFQHEDYYYSHPKNHNFFSLFGSLSPLLLLYFCNFFIWDNFILLTGTSVVWV